MKICLHPKLSPNEYDGAEYGLSKTSYNPCTAGLMSCVVVGELMSYLPLMVPSIP